VARPTGHGVGDLRQALAAVFGDHCGETLDDLARRVTTVHLPRGETLYRQGDAASSMHIVLSGRLQVRVRTVGSTARVVAHLGPRECVGETALFTGARRAATVVAVRDTTLGVLTADGFNDAIAHHPRAAINLARLIIGRLSEAQAGRESSPRLRSIAVLPLSRDLDAGEFGNRLQLALLKHGSTVLLTEAAVRGRLAAFAPRSSASADERGAAVEALLDSLEESHDFVLCIAGPDTGEWTRKCLAHADRILLLGDADGPPYLTEPERALLNGSRVDGLPERELVLLHRGDGAPSDTKVWLREREPSRHHHVRWRGNSGFNRLARFLSGNAVGVVLGGGGARGLAHIGVIRALREAGVPIDAVGGTSFGAAVAGLVAKDLADSRILDEFRAAFVYGRPTHDYTLPLISLVRGDRLEETLQTHLGTASIEDLWLPFFAISSNLTRSAMTVHTEGPLWRAVRASVSLPAIFPPWVENGELLVDGGVINNVPADVMRERVTGTVIAVDLSVPDEFRSSEATVPSPWAVLHGRLRRSHESTMVPTLHRVVIKATTLSGRRELETTRGLADLHLNPPVGGFDLLAWDRFHDIVRAGYEYGKRTIAEWIATHPAAVQRDEYFDSRRRSPEYAAAGL
jgi:NTE family protein